jgi:TonB family protein
MLRNRILLTVLVQFLALGNNHIALAQTAAISSIEADVSALEKRYLGTQYDDDLIGARVERLEALRFGKVQSGLLAARILQLQTGSSSKTAPQNVDRAGLRDLKNTIQSKWIPPVSGSFASKITFLTDNTDSEKVFLHSQSGSAAFDSAAKSLIKSLLPVHVDGMLEKTDLQVLFSNGQVDVYRNPEIDFGGYMSLIQKKLKANWRPPKEREYGPTVIQFKVKRDGTVSNVKLDKSSGYEAADSAGLAAFALTGQLPALPEGAPDSVDIQFTFDRHITRGSEPSSATNSNSSSVFPSAAETARNKNPLPSEPANRTSTLTAPTADGGVQPIPDGYALTLVAADETLYFQDEIQPMSLYRERGRLSEYLEALLRKTDDILIDPAGRNQTGWEGLANSENFRKTAARSAAYYEKLAGFADSCSGEWEWLRQEIHGWIGFRNKNYADALEFMRKAYLLKPNDWDVRRMLAVIEWKAGDRRSAIDLTKIDTPEQLKQRTHVERESSF